MDKDYLLKKGFAKELYYSVAKDLPLIDYHNHLSVPDLKEDRQFHDITEAWLLGDPYKHRLMRICGVEEEKITGTASNYEKFLAWCEVYPRLIGTPVYDWSRIELDAFFGIEDAICKSNARKIWDETKAKLGTAEYTARGLYNHFNIEYAAPCASLCDELEQFSCIGSLAASLRADDIVLPKRDMIKTLCEKTGIRISDLDSFKTAVSKRLEAFQKAGTCFSDHAIDNGFYYLPDDGKNDLRFKSILKGDDLPEKEEAALKSCILQFLCGEYAKRKWTVQLHIGAQRATSTRLRKAAGRAGGFAAIGNSADIAALCRLLDDVEQGEYGLPQMILYTLNPTDNAAIAVLSGSFVGITQGPAWWWCDHIQGMREMLDHFSAYSVLSTFPGMTTDSRSLFSLSRHDYFRRVLCEWTAERVEDGILPNDPDILQDTIRKICYENARKYIVRGAQI